MYVNCDYYRVFYYVAKYGSLSQAARLLLAGQLPWGVQTWQRLGT